MLIPLGVLAASGAGAIGPTYELISTTLITSATPSVTFDTSSLASNYKHLQIRLVGRPASTNVNFFMRFNNDSGSNYSFHEVYSYAVAAVQSGSGLNVTSMKATYSDSAVSTSYGAGIIDILDAFSTSKNKTIRGFVGAMQDKFVALRSGLWNNTASINSILLYSEGGVNIAAGSRFSLYGIRG